MNKDFNGLVRHDAVASAQRLLGCLIVRTFEGKKIVGRIVETEAYEDHDAASHSFKGRTPRTEVLFGPPGRAYVYFTYGMHYCLNVVTGAEGKGSAVLIRALEPVEGVEVLRKNRPKALTDAQLTNGPAKLCQALQVDKTFNGHNLTVPPLQLVAGPPVNDAEVVRATRIGISRDQHRLWRFYIKNNAFVSHT